LIKLSFMLLPRRRSFAPERRNLRAGRSRLEASAYSGQPRDPPVRAPGGADVVCHPGGTEAVTDWACACGAELVSGPVVAGYLGSAFTITLLTCAACALELVPEGLALGKMAEVEQLLEDK